MTNFKIQRVFKIFLKTLGSNVKTTCKQFEKNKQNCERHQGIEMTNFKISRAFEITLKALGKIARVICKQLEEKTNEGTV